jgi:hypothetical protein
MEARTDLIEECRRWVSSPSRFLLIPPAVLACAGLVAISDRRLELLADGQLFLLMLDGLLAMIVGRTDVEVDRRGFRLRGRPAPAGVRGEEHDKETVKQLFARHIRESEGRNVWADRYYAAVELAGGPRVPGHR